MHLISKQLVGQRRFILYRLQPYVDKPGFNKIPTNPSTGYDSSAQDPTTWLTYEDAETAADAWNIAPVAPVVSYGVGVTIHGGLWCIDLDKCRDENGGWQPHATAFMAQFPGALIETSVSGNGLHIYGTTEPTYPEHGAKNKSYRMEAYTDKRFIALGTPIGGDCRTDHTKTFTNFLHRYFPPPEASTAEWTDKPVAAWSGPSDDEALLTIARRSKSARSAFAGAPTFTDLHDHGTYSNGDESSADLAYFNMLAFWTGNDCERMERIAGGSALRRAKWDREDYRRNTILKACASQTEWYKGRGDGAVSVPQTAPAVAASAATVPDTTVTVSFEIPDPPTADEVPAGTPSPMGAAAPLTVRGEQLASAGQLLLFKDCTYVQDIFEIMTPNGYTLDKKRFDVEHSGRTYILNADGKITDSAWDAFTGSAVVEFPRVRGCFFDPRLPPLTVVEREGTNWINSWSPVEIRMEPGDVEPFLHHLRTLFPHDWRTLLNYLKFQMQNKGEKCLWWPFLQGVPGNGKSFISATMEYCLGRKYTQKPTPKNIASNFNASLYGCLFVALEDVKIADDYGAMWETLKPMITQDSLEIEFKGVNKVTREVCFNGIMNSNHRNGIRKERDDRRIGSFFSAQQYKRDLIRDGLTQSYFETLWKWSKADGWAHVAHYLNTDPIDSDFRSDYAPVTSCTAEHIYASLSPMEQAVMQAMTLKTEGFRNGWISSAAVDSLLHRINRGGSMSLTAKRDLVLSLGYVPHPSLVDGLCMVALPDATTPYLYVCEGHAWAVDHLTPQQVRDGYLQAQKTI